MCVLVQSFCQVFNFLIIGVDSVSRLNFVRQMTQTRLFLLNELSAYELLGYNKVSSLQFKSTRYIGN